METIAEEDEDAEQPLDPMEEMEKARTFYAKLNAEQKEAIDAALYSLGIPENTDQIPHKGFSYTIFI